MLSSQKLLLPPFLQSASAPARPRASPQPLDDTLFPLEGFEEAESEECDAPPPGLAFPQSDDEEISTDDSSYRDVSALNMLGIATSVPVSVPMFPRDKEQEHRGSVSGRGCCCCIFRKWAGLLLLYSEHRGSVSGRAAVAI